MERFFDELHSLRLRPIPDLADARRRRMNYRQHPIDRFHPKHLEALAEISIWNISGRNYYYRTDNPPYYMSIPGSIEKLLVRQSVGIMLKEADKRCRSAGVKIHVHDAFRPIEVQSYFHDTWMPEKVQLKYPHMVKGELLKEVEKYWAAPTRSSDSPAPHSTGAALDLTLYTIENNEPLYMGSIFDDVTEKANMDYFELASAMESYSDLEALQNRRLLYWVLTEAGFASNPNEWWHFSWGDQMWARIIVQDAAIYTVTKMPVAEGRTIAENLGECAAASG